jgi:predicted AAA+ superfamily ATPase
MRYLSEGLLKDLEKHMVLLSGPRQCGKTTLAQDLLNSRFRGEYFNWDQPKDRKRILGQDWDENSALIVFDEIHKKKDWKNFIKGVFDTRPKTLRMLVTGSARLELFQKSGDSMFGRFRAWRLHPFCLAEDPLNLSHKLRLERQLDRGSFPFPYLAENADEALRWRNQRWSLLLREDLRDLESIRNIQELEVMAELLKGYASGLLSYANLAEDAEIAPKSAKTWVSALEKIYLIFRVPPYAGSLKRSLSKTPKVYFMDVGDLRERGLGERLENVVALNLLKRIHFLEDAYGERMGLGYVRDREHREVDFVITRNRRPVALIEVKASRQSPDPSLLYFKSRLKVEHSIQVDAQTDLPEVKKSGVRLCSIPHFFSRPLSDRAFWE